MDNVFKFMGGFFKSLTSLLIGLAALAVLVEVVFGTTMFGMSSVVDNITGLITKLGDGVAIKIMDASTICDTRMVNFMRNQASKNNIKWQNEILTAGGTDTASIQRMTPGGSIAGAFSIPTRHIHQVIEMVHKSDVKNCIDLMTICLSKLDQSDWKF